ncbi:MAG: glutathione peroxidase [Spirochaetales bacterium]|nr:glutathione peroxidase [Spirochaetales bacterium]
MSFYDHRVRTLKGSEQNLSDFKGKVCLVVNVASKCGFTPQYTGLEEIWKKYRDRGLVVLGFPCNQFGSQEPGTADEIESFCQLNYGVSFPLFEKIDVNGATAHPLYAYLTGEGSGHPGEIKWNFEKFLIDREGKPVRRFSSRIKPEGAEMTSAIEALLG